MGNTIFVICYNPVRLDLVCASCDMYGGMLFSAGQTCTHLFVLQIFIVNKQWQIARL